MPQIAYDVLENSGLRSAIHKLVWNVYLKPETFEEKWTTLMARHKLHLNAWLNDMFSIRHLWVPAYFREIPMCCLMKTTSRCESSNALFKVNSSFANTLVHFFMSFDTAIDQQRYNQRMLEFKTNTTTPDFKTGLEIERHAAQLYTQSVFNDVQKEIRKSMMFCYITNVDVDDQTKVFTVSHMDHRSEFVNEFYVSCSESFNSVVN
jgi:hypothetical protein